jgi:hypothetical protein
MRSRCASGCGGIDDLFVSVSPSLSLTISDSGHLKFQCRLLEWSRTATPAERVRLVMALSETGSSLRCIAVSLEVRLQGAAERGAYSCWARNCAQNYCQQSIVLSKV